MKSTHRYELGPQDARKALASYMATQTGMTINPDDLKLVLREGRGEDRGGDAVKPIIVSVVYEVNNVWED